MKQVINLYKPQGLTPLQLLEKFASVYPEYKDIKLGYAGRLDPMAEGVLIVLVDGENKKRKHYESLQKTYSFDMLFGVTTDTYDALGMITEISQTSSPKSISDRLPGILAEVKKRTSQKYPPYSSQTVKGKPLYYWARHNRLHEITLPKHPVTIYQLSIQNIDSAPSEKIKQYIFQTTRKVMGDFRQEKILASWEVFFSEEHQLILAECRVTCSSGTYVRSLCHETGQKLGTGAIALRIRRDRVGDFTIEQSLKLS